jgi:hypothetical protein
MPGQDPVVCVYFPVKTARDSLFRAGHKGLDIWMCIYACFLFEINEEELHSHGFWTYMEIERRYRYRDRKY